MKTTWISTTWKCYKILQIRLVVVEYKYDRTALRSNPGMRIFIVSRLLLASVLIGGRPIYRERNNLFALSVGQRNWTAPIQVLAILDFYSDHNSSVHLTELCIVRVVLAWGGTAGRISTGLVKLVPRVSHLGLFDHMAGVGCSWRCELW